MGKEIIKFRAWHKNIKEMCMNVTTDLLDRDYLVFMQYVGMKDDKITKEYPEGKEIYEGDIVLCDGKYYEVVRHSYIFQLKEFYCSCFDDPQDAFSEAIVEVVGNIYENPELLSLVE